MSLLETIRANHLIARRERNAVISNLLGVLIGELSALEKNRPESPIVDADVIKIAKKMAESARETVGLLQKETQSATDPMPGAIRHFQHSVYDVQRIADLWTEIGHLEGMLPKQLDEAALRTAIQQIVESGAKNIGEIMAGLKARHAGMYDGKLASTIAREVKL